MPDLTSAERRVLEGCAASSLGVVGFIGPHNGFRYSSWKRMMTRLCGMGLVAPYVHGGFEITDAGRAALSEGRPC